MNVDYIHSETILYDEDNTTKLNIDYKAVCKIHSAAFVQTNRK